MSDGHTPDPQSKVVAFPPKKREPRLKFVRASYDDCRHVSVFVSQAKRAVTCQACSVQLDAFQVLLEMANKERRWLDDLEAWEAMRDSRLSDRYDAEWERRSGDIKEPPTDPELRRVWDVFHAVVGDKFCGMYRRKARKRTGPEWYGRDNRGGCVSLEYARSLLVPKLIPPTTKQATEGQRDPA